MSAAAISLRGVAKRFGTLDVLEGIEFDVAAGETVALLGTSGCGKSTLLNIVAGLVDPDGGELWLDGARAARLKDRRGLAYMFQEDRLLPWRSVRANAEFGLEAARPALAARERRARAEAALDMVGLSGFAERYPHQLSGGMRSRVALARSLVGEPQVLLMDEPFSKLDPQTRSQMHDELLRLRALQQMTVLFVTHDVEEAVVLADRVVVLAPRPGRVREIVPITLPRPRRATDPEVAEAIRQLRLLI
ncbi:nitrate/sulfonate/bicarbonate ABC transporter ATP-binding protein [Burkholderia sp. WAC0059]|uniref:ABC transporter ATP-binding protein n=1 Tax=Burkholderia sp. WAC0059 TaxID=2066022 RepID=UPI000C7F7768|nr:ABC transporter ATP-binding protein [Burkholderia sp. WAC0059]PLZ02898.1 nitrate/sulfonate/bicarbonate ABC transporter ATP-binding protein [Burkholderia sp. WAC0059]